MAGRLRRRRLQQSDDGRIGRPPANVAGTFVKVAVDDLDHVEGEVGEPLAAHLLDHPLAELAELGDRAGKLGLEVVGDVGDAAGNGFHLAGDHGEAAAGIAGARRLDEGVERQNLGLRR